MQMHFSIARRASMTTSMYPLCGAMLTASILLAMGAALPVVSGTPSIDLIAGHGRSLKAKQFDHLPGPDELLKIPSEPAKQLRQSILDAKQLTPAVVSEFVKRLIAAAAAHGSRSSKWKVVQDQSGMLLPYLRATPSLAPLLEALRHFGSGALKGKALDAKLQALVGKLQPDAFYTWVVKVQAGSTWKAPIPRGIQERMQADQVAQAAAGAGAVARSTGAAAPVPDLNDPIVQLNEFQTRLKSFNQTFSFLYTTRKEPSNPKNRYLNVGLTTFKPRRIGLIFHVMLFKDEFGWLYPPQAYWSGNARAQRMVDAMNRLYRYSGSNIQFYIKEYRANGTRWQYLVFPSLAKYQACAAASPNIYQCTCPFARSPKSSVQPDKYVNIYVVGDPYGYPGLDPTVYGNVGASSIIPPFVDYCNTVDLSYSPTATPKRQHLWLSFSALDTFRFNSASRANTGANFVAHELGHLLGLLHPQQNRRGDDVTCDSVNDYVADTSVELNANLQPWFSEARRWCVRLGTFGSTTDAAVKGTMKTLTQFDSCPRFKYIDNIFNVMSYAPPECQFYFTRGQVKRMQTVLGTTQARLGT